MIGSKELDVGREYRNKEPSQGLGAQGNARECDVDYDDGSGVEESCDGVKWGCSHGGEDGWGCCGDTRDGLEEGGKRELDRSSLCISVLDTHPKTS